jgi:hypothetical protein
MAKKPLPVARTRVSIGGATATWTEVAVAADTWVLIDGIRTIGNFGDSAQVITVDEVGDGRTRKAKGTRNSGTMELTCSKRSTDPGQIALDAASASDEAFNFKIELPQGDGTFEVNYITALVMSNPVGLGGPNDTQTKTYSLELNEAPLTVDPA